MLRTSNKNLKIFVTYMSKIACANFEREMLLSSIVTKLQTFKRNW